jgi:hypothetical protein
MRAIVPVTVAAACAVTGEVTLDPLTGLHTCTPGLPGALQLPPLLMV